METAYEPMQQPPSSQCDNPSTIKINDPTTEIVPPNEPSHSGIGKYSSNSKTNLES